MDTAPDRLSRGEPPYGSSPRQWPFRSDQPWVAVVRASLIGPVALVVFLALIGILGKWVIE